jgi:hypothetical protein
MQFGEFHPHSTAYCSTIWFHAMRPLEKVKAYAEQSIKHY